MLKANLMKKGWIAALLVVLGLAFAAPAFAISSCYIANAMDNYVYADSIGGTRAANGWVLQIIYASGGTIHDPNPDGTPGGGDTLIDALPRTVGYMGQDGNFFFLESAITDGATVYVRVWNADNLDDATHYGDSTTFVVNNPFPAAPVAFELASFVTDTPKPVPTPTITAANPTSAYQGDILDSVSLTGSNTNFDGTSTISFGAGVDVDSVTQSSITSIRANTVTINTSAATGARTVTVTTGGEVATGNVFTINQPTVSSRSPEEVDDNWGATDFTVNTAGTHFIQDTTTASGTDITVTNVQVTDGVGEDQQVVVTFTLNEGISAGSKTLTITTDLGARGTETITTNFTVNAVAEPEVAVSPTTLTFNYTIDGDAPAAQTVTVTDANDTGSLNWTATDNATWLNLTPNGTGDGDTISVAVTTDQPAGTHNGTITVTDDAGDSATVPVTYNVSEADNNNPTAPTLTAPANGAVGVSTTPTFTWDPSTDADGDTVTYTLTVSGDDGATNYADVTSPYTLAEALAEGNYTWTIAANDGRGGSATSSTFSFTVGEISEVVIDDFSGVEVNAGPNTTWGDGDDDYYPFSENDVAHPVLEQITAGDAPNGASYVAITLPAVPAAEAEKGYSWRGYSATLINSVDISAFENIKFSLRGDGTADVDLKLQLTDGAGHIVAVADTDTTNLQDLLTTTWQEVTIPVSALVPIAGAVEGPFDYTDVVSYQFVFTGINASVAAINIDYLRADDASSGPVVPTGPTIVSISPSPASPGDTITITGDNLSTSGKVEFDSDAGTFTTKAEGSTITAWSANEVTMTLPTLSAGQQEVKIVTDAGEESNTVILDVLASKTGESHNYPNPFNPVGGEETTVVFQLPSGADSISLYVFDTTARQVYKGAWDNTLAVGEITWNGQNYVGEVLGDGVYLYRVVNEADKSIIGKGKILVINR